MGLLYLVGGGFGDWYCCCGGIWMGVGCELFFDLFLEFLEVDIVFLFNGGGVGNRCCWYCSCG